MVHKVEDPKEFFWKHMQKDLSMACKALNITLDEMYILLHRILNDFLYRNKSKI